MSMPPDRLAALSPEKRALLAQRLAQKTAAPTAGPQAQRIAVVAAACRLPGGVDSLDGFWAMLAEGRDAVTDVPPDRWNAAELFAEDGDAPNRIQSRCGGFLRDVDRFDAAFFGISPREAAAMDPQQRLLLELAWEALEAGGQSVDRMAGSACGVFVGAHSHSSDYWLLQMAQRGGVESHSATGSAHSILANRISYALDLRGPSMAVDTACSSSLVAVHLACQSLRSGECDAALAGGVNLMLGPSASLAFSKLRILSAGGRCRSFDATADGIVRGEGAALVLLKRLPDALRDGDPVLALIAGSAVNQDGASNGLTAPNGPAQEAVIRRALAMGGISAARYGYVETHGTGTPLGDPVEVEALARVIGAPADAAQRCWLGALKSNIGHLEAAAGIAGLIKAVLCLREGRVPRNLHYTSPNPHLRLAGTPLAIPTSLADWPPASMPRVAGVSSFGFGGTNAHVVLEEFQAEATGESSSAAASRDEWLTVSARDRGALAELLRGTVAALRALPAGPCSALADFAHTARQRRSHHPFRVAVHGPGAQVLADRLEARLDDVPGLGPAAAQGRAVWVFSGQGGLWPGAARDLYDTEPAFRTALDGVATLFAARAGWDLREPLLSTADAPRLEATEVAQPVLFGLQVALAALWRASGVMPGAVIGHSVGEVAAAHAAGVLTLADAVRVIHERSRAMQPAAGRGRMAQVECSETELGPELATGDVCVAAINGPRTVVLAGAPNALDDVLARLARRGVQARLLPMPYAFHSAQMAPFVPLIESALAGLTPRPAAVPMVSTVTAGWAGQGTSDDFAAAYWGRNVREPVRFAAAMAQLIEAGYRSMVEIGPHPTLAAGMLDCAESAGQPVVVVASLRRAQPARAAYLQALCTLYEGGTEIDWAAAVRDPGRRVARLPTYPWQRQRYWLDEPDAQSLVFSVTGRRADPAVASVHGGTTPAAAHQGIGCYEMGWPLAPGRRAWASMAAIDLGALRRDANHGLREHPLAAPLCGEAAVMTALERRGAELAWNAVLSLGLGRDSGAVISTDPLDAGVSARHARLWARLLQLAATLGHLEARDGGFRVTPAGARAAAWPERDRAGAAGATRTEAALLERCGGQLAAVLRGEADPLALLFPEGEASGGEPVASASEVYSRTPSARLYNAAAAALVSRMAAEAGRPLRVLEIGAGTGATTHALLPVLPQGGEYCFTDVSALFLHEAEQRFGQGRTSQRFDFRRLDIESDPIGQGFDPAAFDLIVAANVLHATADLRRTLQHARQLLAQGGVLLLIETVAQRAWADLSFGMTEGWWRFADAPLRTHQALLEPDAWCAALSAAGFEDAQAIGEELSRQAVHPQAVLLARAGAARRSPRQRFAGTTWQIVADRGGFGERLTAALRIEGARCSLSTPDAEPTLEDAGARVVHCGALDAPPAADIDTDRLSAAIEAGVGSALAWARLLARRGDDALARLWLVTRGAQWVQAGASVLAPAAALNWGLGRSIALEDPAHWGGLIDLDPCAGVDANLAALLDALAADDREDQIAIRAGAQRMARLRPRPTPATAPRVLDASAGAVLVTGGYGGLGPKVADWLASRGARRIVLVGRSGVPAGAAGEAFDAALAPLRERGVEFVMARADVADADAMRRLFEQQAADGHPVRGIVHAAASIRFQPLGSLDAADLREALRAKVQGAWVLHELTRALPAGQELDYFVLFSSATTLFGAKGLAAYATANQFLAALAHHRVELGLPATCIDWGAWSEIRLLGRDHEADITRLGYRPMKDEKAFEVQTALVQAGVPVSMVADVDWATACEAYQAQGRRPFLDEMARHAKVPEVTTAGAGMPEAHAGAAPNPGPAEWRASLVPLDARARRERVAALVRLEVARVLQLAGPHAVDPAKGFFEMGLDSLMAMQLRRRLSDATGITLAATVAFNHPSLWPLADHLLQRLELPATEEGAAAPLPQAAVASVDTLSDDEVRQALQRELAAAGLLDDDAAPTGGEGP